MNKNRIFLILFILFSSRVFSLDIQEDIVEKGSGLVGTPYRYGGTNPSGFDCSGLVNFLFKPHIPSLPRTSSGLSLYGITIPFYEISAGDLVFYATGSDRNEITHVGIYIGQNTLIQAVSAGPERGVILTDLDEKYWKDRYKWAKRVLPQVNKKDLENISMDFNKGHFSGSANNYEPEGDGQMILENGDTYKGQFHNGLFHGFGEYRYGNGDIYVGNFDQGRESGGEILKSDGSRYYAERNVQGRLFIGNRIDTGNTRTNYLMKSSTNWDDWLSLEMEQFEASKKAGESAAQSELERFEEWKKNN